MERTKCQARWKYNLLCAAMCGRMVKLVAFRLAAVTIDSCGRQQSIWSHFFNAHIPQRVHTISHWRIQKWIRDLRRWNFIVKMEIWTSSQLLCNNVVDWKKSTTETVVRLMNILFVHSAYEAKLKFQFEIFNKRGLRKCEGLRLWKCWKIENK